MKKKILVQGPALTQSGYGEQTRFALRALRKYEDLFDIYVLPTPWGNCGWIWDDTEERRWIDELVNKTQNYCAQFADQAGIFDISLQVTVPNEWQGLAPVNIGYTAGIETTKMSYNWIGPCNAVDRIITVSEHGAYAIRNTKYEGTDAGGNHAVAKVDTPVHVVNYATRDIKPKELDLKLDHDFNFLAVAQISPRKNIEATVRGFVEEFADQEVGLVIKCSTVKNCILDRYMTESAFKNLLAEYSQENEDRKCKVYMLHGDMTDEEMAGLYNHPKIKCLISLAHGEGFGLPIFEAVCNGLPVIAPAWGGQNDFIHMVQKVKKRKNKKVKIVTKPTCMISDVSYEVRQIQPEAVWQDVLLPESQWCFPKDWRYKVRLREMRKRYSEHLARAKKLQDYVLENFTPEQKYKEFAEAVLGVPVSSISEVTNKDIPKISILTSIYNGDEFIEQFMEDITRQTIFKDKCELIIIDGNSPGNEIETIKKYQKKFPSQIIYRRLDEDPGIYGCWNEALKLATGEFITNANLDDRKKPNSLERHAKELIANPDVGLVYADSFRVKEGNKQFEDFGPETQKYNFEQFSLEAMLRGNQAHNNPMWRKSLNDKFGDFNPEYKSAGDWDFFLRCCFGGTIFKKINEILGVYFFNPTGMSTNPENESWKRKEEMRIFKQYQKLYVERQAEAAKLQK